MNIRYFFAKDRVDKEEVLIHYCPTGKMLADYFTKPLQGKAFPIFSTVIMELKPLWWIKKNLLPTEQRFESTKIVDESKDTTKKDLFARIKTCKITTDCLQGNLYLFSCLTATHV